MTDEIPEKELRRKKWKQKKLRNPFARALHEELRFVKKIHDTRKKDRLRPQDMKRLISGDINDDEG